MGRSRRKYKQSRTNKVRVGLPKKNPNVIKPAFTVPPKLLRAVSDTNPEWDAKGTVIRNYKSFGVVSNPNLLNVRSRTPRIVENDSLQVPPPPSDAASEFDDSVLVDSGSDLEEDDLKTALGKRRRDGKGALPKPLTTMQRVHISRLVDKYGDDFESMFFDIKLNRMQHSLATLKGLCMRYHMYKNKNPLILV